ncbi:YajG family lipoprotein [Veronia pacifica]|uniref:Type IV secretion system putative lipoprotein virB7 n=1 Tax=Veronia pacifica TaxID=1080227 RepID=A0A1C3EF79_9GAMM|nr:YajG family lipoprotein [Veronia pacifica]ODA31895.1 hypothetical protein A8L45_14935 [Veronia pacifica]
MKKLFSAIGLTFLLSACSAPQAPQLNITPQPAKVAASTQNSGKTVDLSSRDLRTAQYVAVVDNGRRSVDPIHAKANLRVALENALGQQLSAQGFTLSSASEGKLRMDLLEALVKVKHNVFNHEMDSQVQIQLVAESAKGKFVKRYRGQSKIEDAGSASPEDMETALNSLLEAVLNDIANDKQLTLYMDQNF